MKTLDMINIPLEKVLENSSQPREIFEKEGIDLMGRSIKKVGLMNPIIVRPYNGCYQIIAGGRRYRAAKALGEKEIQAKVVEADDIEAAIMSIAENYHRKDLTPAEREKAIYSAWKKGEYTIFKGMVSIMAEWTGIPKETLRIIISSGKEKEVLKSKVIQDATAKDLKITRDLEKISPDVRKELLKLKQSKIVTEESEPKLRQPKPVIGITDLDHTVKAIKSAKKAGISDDIIEDIPKLISQKKILPAKIEDFVNIVIDTPKRLQKEFVRYAEKEKSIEPEKMKTLVDQLKQSPPDIQEKLLKKDIDIEEAKLVSNLQTVEQREQLLKERRVMAEETKKDIDRHTKIRMEQAEAVRQGKEPTSVTKADIEMLKKVNANSFEEQDNRMLNFYRNQNVNLILKAEDIKRMHFDANKKDAVEVIWKIYERCYKVLIELGEIKIYGDINPRTNPVIPKLYGG